jgi:hypothetical protein
LVDLASFAAPAVGTVPEVPRLRALFAQRSAARPLPPRSSLVGTLAPPITGVTPDGRALSVDGLGEPVGPVLAFLTSSCQPCQPFWAELQPAIAGRQVVIVTPSPSMESRRAVAALGRPERTTVMSSEAWNAYGVTASSWFVVVDRGTVTAEARASSWADIRAILKAVPS